MNKEEQEVQRRLCEYWDKRINAEFKRVLDPEGVSDERTDFPPRDTSMLRNVDFSRKAN